MRPVHRAVALPPSVLKVRDRASVAVVGELDDGRDECEEVDGAGFAVRLRTGFWCTGRSGAAATTRFLRGAFAGEAASRRWGERARGAAAGAFAAAAAGRSSACRPLAARADPDAARWAGPATRAAAEVACFFACLARRAAELLEAD